MTHIKPHPDAVIASTIAALTAVLQEAAYLAQLATDNFAHGGRNLAIGTILPLEQTLPAANSLLQAALTLHRLPWKGGAE